MKPPTPFKENFLSHDGHFLLQEQFIDYYRNFDWYGIFEPDFSLKFYSYLEQNNYYYVSYDLNLGFSESKKICSKNIDLLFFECCVIYNNQQSLIYNWFSEFLIVNSAKDIFLPIYNLEIDSYAESFGGPFNEIKEASTNFISRLANSRRVFRGHTTN